MTPETVAGEGERMLRGCPRSTPGVPRPTEPALPNLGLIPASVSSTLRLSVPICEMEVGAVH